jgi:hypothetical protein
MEDIEKVIKMNFIFSLEIYPFDVMVSIGENDEELKEKLNEVGVDAEGDNNWHYEATGLGRAISFPGNQTLLRLRNKPETTADYGTLAHEIFHICEFILHKVGINLTRDSDEAYAYLIGFVTRKIYESIFIEETELIPDQLDDVK